MQNSLGNMYWPPGQIKVVLEPSLNTQFLCIQAKSLEMIALLIIISYLHCIVTVRKLKYIITISEKNQLYLWASSSSFTALSTSFRLLFSSFRTEVASLCSTKATLNIRTVSLGATCLACK